MRCKPSQLVDGLANLTRSTTGERTRENNKIHIGGGQIKPRCKRAKAMNVCVERVAVSPAPCTDSSLNASDEIETSLSLKIAGLNVVEEVADFFMKSGMSVSQVQEDMAMM